MSCFIRYFMKGHEGFGRNSTYRARAEMSYNIKVFRGSVEKVVNCSVVSKRKLGELFQSGTS